VYKDVIGLRTLVISSDDSHSKEISQRMWFENQKVHTHDTRYEIENLPT
jgi:hypothetical protein